MINFYEKKINGSELQIINYGADNALFAVGSSCRDYADYSMVFEDIVALVKTGSSTTVGEKVGSYEEYEFNDKTHWLDIHRNKPESYRITAGMYPTGSNREAGVSYSYDMPVEDYDTLISFFGEFTAIYS